MDTTTITLASGSKVTLITTPQMFVIERAADGTYIDWHGPVCDDADAEMQIGICNYYAEWHYKDGRTAQVEMWTETDLWDMDHDEDGKVTR